MIITFAAAFEKRQRSKDGKREITVNKTGGKTFGKITGKAAGNFEKKVSKNLTKVLEVLKK